VIASRRPPTALTSRSPSTRSTRLLAFWR
jgi:hypothetical protein